MPIYEYDCPLHGRFSKFFKTFTEAEEHIDETPCGDCGSYASRAASVPLPAHFYGNPEGYHKPSPTKRYNTKLVSAKEGNTNAGG